MYEEIGKRLRKQAGGKAEARPPENGSGEAPDFSRALKRLRGDAGLSLEKLSEVTGINKQTLHSIENRSIRNPSFANLEKIAAAFKTTLADLVELGRAEGGSNLYKTTAAQRWSISFETEKGFSIHSFTPAAAGPRDFFVGVMNLQGGKKLKYWKFKAGSKACIQPWDGDILFIYHGTNWRREEKVIANETLTFDASIPHSFQNLSPAANRVLLVTYPPLF